VTDSIRRHVEALGALEQYQDLSDSLRVDGIRDEETARRLAYAYLCEHHGVRPLTETTFEARWLESDPMD
jgi:hypothetical protein